tara:strand:+ start:46 stop:516 length:471 start_codon:yes stop_codon:yes gene_type:complete
MRHLKSGRKLGRTSAHRKALFNNLASALVRYELIQTTDPKAKELRKVSDRLITLGKKDTLDARRQAFAILKDRELVSKLFDDLAKREDITSRQGGYTRIIKLGNRRGDNAPVSRVSWVGADLENTEALRYPKHILDRFEQAELSYQLSGSAQGEEE